MGKGGAIRLGAHKANGSEFGCLKSLDVDWGGRFAYFVISFVGEKKKKEGDTKCWDRLKSSLMSRSDAMCGTF